MPAGQPQFPTLEEKVDADNRSIYVGQVIFYITKLTILLTKTELQHQVQWSVKVPTED